MSSRVVTLSGGPGAPLPLGSRWLGPARLRAGALPGFLRLDQPQALQRPQEGGEGFQAEEGARWFRPLGNLWV